MGDSSDSSDSDSDSSSDSDSNSSSDSDSSSDSSSDSDSDLDSDSDSDSSSDSSSGSSSSSDSDSDSSANPRQPTKRPADDSPASNKRTKTDSSQTESIESSGSVSPVPEETLKPGQRKHFSRIDRSKVSFEDSTLQDNTYKGAAGTWGEMASEKLLQVRGKDFTKNKNKMKRGSYRGGSITLNSGSYKFKD